MNQDLEITRRAGVTLMRTGGEGVLVDEATDRVHVVNATAARVWELCVPGATVDGVIAAIAAEFSASPDEVAADVTDLLQSFAQLDVVELAALS